MGDNMEESHHTTVTVVGGGLVGALHSCYMARRGYKVNLYELRSDIRQQEVVKGRSINLALSVRGREALRGVGLEDKVTATGIPMYARMIHDRDGTCRPIPYGKSDQYIMSIDRKLLNEVLLTEAESHPEVTLFFEHKLHSVNTITAECVFETPDGERKTVKSDLVVGCDGAYSAVRRQIMKSTRLDFSQQYIPHGYMELNIPAKDGQFAMEEEYLHIWPRNTFMMIGLPNRHDKSFVGTLFMPFNIFDSINTEQDLINFFNEKFPDALPLLGKEELIDTYFKSEPLPLVSIKCSPYHVGDKVIILGDAAHAMVPFYGQGMNCGFEDCLVFNEMLDKCNGNLGQAMQEYSAVRGPDAKAICDLAMYNYVEMRSSVNSRLFLLRKKIDNFLHWLLPNTWVPLYAMVSFTRIRYQHCISRKGAQDKIITYAASAVAVAALTGLSMLAWRGFSTHSLPELSQLLSLARDQLQKRGVPI